MWLLSLHRGVLDLITVNQLLPLKFVNSGYNCICCVCRKWLLKLHGIEELSRVPLYQHVVTTITGRTTIQAFAKDKDFIAE
jgi:hypothetical protein